VHKQQLQFPFETPECSRRRRRRRRTRIPSTRELHDSRRAGDRSRCILTLITLRLLYAPSERHLCYTLPRGCSFAVAVHTTVGDIYAILRPIANTALSFMFSFQFVPHIAVVFTSDTSLAVVFALPLTYFTCLKYTVHSSHSLVLCPQSTTF
jgi:hypothetical protein